MITAAVVYFIFVVPMNKIPERRAAKTAAGEPDPAPKSEDIILLEQIRDLLLAAAAHHPPTQSQPGLADLPARRAHRGAAGARGGTTRRRARPASSPQPTSVSSRETSGSTGSSSSGRRRDAGPRGS